MKTFCKTLLFLLVCSNIWGQNFTLKEITPGYINGPFSGYISSCEIPPERVFKLMVHVSSNDDKVKLTKVYFSNTCFYPSGTTILSPTSPVNGTYKPASNIGPQHIEFIIKTKDSYVPRFDCNLLVDWTYEDKVTTTVNNTTTTTTTTTTRQGVKIKEYWYLGSSTEPISYSYPSTKPCGNDDQIEVFMDYENDIDNYTVSAINAAVLYHYKTPGNSPCDNRITIGLKPEACGDIAFIIDRSNTAGSKRDQRTIRSELNEVGINTIKTSSGETNFCLEDGPVVVNLKGAFNEHFFGVDNPLFSKIDELLDACPSNISANWSVYSSSTPGGVSIATWGTTVDFAYGQVTIYSEGEYIISYVLEACGQQFERKIKLKACVSKPYLPSAPPIDLQYVCSLEEPICSNVGGCIDELKVNNADYRFHYSQQGSQLCISSSYLKARTNNIQVNASNACGDATANWAIYIDNPEYCEGSGYEMTIEQGTQSIAIQLKAFGNPSTLSDNNSMEEIIEKVLIYDINGRLVWSDHVKTTNNYILLPNDAFQQAGTYVIQAITNVKSYSQPFIRH